MLSDPLGDMVAALDAVGAAVTSAQGAVEIASTESLTTYLGGLATLATAVRQEALPGHAELTAEINKATNALVAPMNSAESAAGSGFVNVDGATLWQRELTGAGKALIEAKAALTRAEAAAEKVAKWADGMKGHYAEAHQELANVMGTLAEIAPVLPTQASVVQRMRGLPSDRARGQLLEVREWLAAGLVKTGERREAFMESWQSLIQKTKGNDPPSFVSVKDGLVSVEDAIKAAGSAGHELFMALGENEGS